MNTVCGNPDRHTLNYGVLRDMNRGEIIGMAPSLKNNLALIARGYPKNLQRKNALLRRRFCELLEFNSAFSKFVPVLTREMILEAIQSVNMKIRTNAIFKFIFNGYHSSHMIRGEQIKIRRNKDVGFLMNRRLFLRHLF